MELNESIGRCNLYSAVEFKGVFHLWFVYIKGQGPIYFHVYHTDFNTSYSDYI